MLLSCAHVDGTTSLERSTSSFSSARQRTRVAALLFFANVATVPHTHGRNAANKTNLPERNWPSDVTNWSVGGMSKSTLSEITLRAENHIPRASAPFATAAASMSTASARYISANLRFCSDVAVQLAVTRIP